MNSGSLDMLGTRLGKQMSHDWVPLRRSADRSWVAVLVLVTLLLAPVSLTIVATRALSARNQPSDAELIENLLANEAKFDELVQMLDSDYRHWVPGAEESIDLAGLAAVVRDAGRMELYKRLLREISVTDLRYFPGSEKLILLPAGAQNHIEGFSKSYAYLVGSQAQPVIPHHGYNWRGPGLYFLTGDRQVKGFWFIHYDSTIAFAFSPY